MHKKTFFPFLSDHLSCSPFPHTTHNSLFHNIIHNVAAAEKMILAERSEEDGEEGKMFLCNHFNEFNFIRSTPIYVCTSEKKLSWNWIYVCGEIRFSFFLLYMRSSRALVIILSVEFILFISFERTILDILTRAWGEELGGTRECVGDSLCVCEWISHQISIWKWEICAIINIIILCFASLIVKMCYELNKPYALSPSRDIFGERWWRMSNVAEAEKKAKIGRRRREEEKKNYFNE